MGKPSKNEQHSVLFTQCNEVDFSLSDQESEVFVHDIELDVDWSDSEQKIQVNSVYGNSICVNSTYLDSCSLLTFMKNSLHIKRQQKVPI